MRRSLAEMVGEFLREAAVLVIVFVPLVRLFERGEPLTAADYLAIVTVGGGALILGI